MSLGERESDKWYELGRVAMLEGLPGRFTKKAGEAFALGEDEAAHLYRTLAQEFKKEAEEARAKYETDYPKRRNG